MKKVKVGITVSVCVLFLTGALVFGMRLTAQLPESVNAVNGPNTIENLAQRLNGLEASQSPSAQQIEQAGSEAQALIVETAKRLSGQLAARGTEQLSETVTLKGAKAEVPFTVWVSSNSEATMPPGYKAIEIAELKPAVVAIGGQFVKAPEVKGPETGKMSSAGQAKIAEQLNTSILGIMDTVKATAKKPTTTSAAAMADWKGIADSVAGLQANIDALRALAKGDLNTLAPDSRKAFSVAEEMVKDVAIGNTVQRALEKAPSLKLTTPVGETTVAEQEQPLEVLIESTPQIEELLNASRNVTTETAEGPTNLLQAVNKKFGCSISSKEKNDILTLDTQNRVVIALTSESANAFEGKGFRTIALQNLQPNRLLELEYIAVLARGWDRYNKIEEGKEKEDLMYAMTLAYKSLTGFNLSKDALASLLLSVPLNSVGPVYAPGQLEDRLMQRLLILVAA